MDFSDFSTYPMVANPDYSPTNDAFSYPDTFDKAYIADAFTTRPDYNFDTFLDTDSFFDRPLTSVETPTTFAPKNPPLFSSPLSAATSTSQTVNLNSWSSLNPAPAPYGRTSNVSDSLLNEGFSTSPSFSNIPASSFNNNNNQSSPRNASPTPSLCGDGPQQNRPISPSLSPRSLKRESPEEAVELDDEPTPKRPQRKRGRPRLDRSSSDATTASNLSSKSRTTQRLPHNQVERKYREGLNSELERLRRAVPTLIQRDPRDLTAPPKPSKATILASAIDYIKKIESERDALIEENEKLRGMRPSGIRNR